MRRTAKYYRNNLIKLGIMSIGGVGIFWDYFTGKGHPDTEPAALVLIALIMVAGNVGLFIAWTRAKLRESQDLELNAIRIKSPSN